MMSDNDMFAPQTQWTVRFHSSCNGFHNSKDGDEMSKEIDEKQAKSWEIISSKLGKMSELIQECEVILIIELGIVEGKPFDRIKDIIDAVSGQSYMFAPQTQWTGGNSLNSKNFIRTLPHIANKGW